MLDLNAPLGYLTAGLPGTGGLVSRPRVVRMITRMAVGGPGRHALLLTRGLADEYDTTLAAGRPAPGEGELSDPRG